MLCRLLRFSKLPPQGGFFIGYFLCPMRSTTNVPNSIIIDIASYTVIVPPPLITRGAPTCHRLSVPIIPHPHDRQNRLPRLTSDDTVSTQSRIHFLARQNTPMNPSGCLRVRQYARRLAADILPTRCPYAFKPACCISISTCRLISSFSARSDAFSAFSAAISSCMT